MWYHYKRLIRRAFRVCAGRSRTDAEDYGLDDNLETVKRRYDSYRFGETEVYTPWSVINYVNSCYRDKNVFAKPYWSNTSSNSIVRNLVEHADISAKGNRAADRGQHHREADP